MIPETVPMFDLVPAEPDPLGAAIRRIVPQASTVQVMDLKELVAAEAERIARPPERMGAFGAR